MCVCQRWVSILVRSSVGCLFYFLRMGLSIIEPVAQLYWHLMGPAGSVSSILQGCHFRCRPPYQAVVEGFQVFFRHWLASQCNVAQSTRTLSRLLFVVIRELGVQEGTVEIVWGDFW